MPDQTPDPKPADQFETVTRKLVTTTGKERTVTMRTLLSADPDDGPEDADDEPEKKRPRAAETTARTEAASTTRPPAANA